jgi:hypothetical protein
MKTQSHTPLPWKYTPDSKEKDGLWDVIVGANGEQVIYGIAYEGCSFENEEADAAFIVRAVNAHEELLQMLHVFIDQIDGDIMATQFFDSTFVNKAKQAIAEAEGR